MDHRIGAAADAALVRHEARHQAALAVQAVRVAASMRGRLGAAVGELVALELVVEPEAIEILDQREIEHVDPHHRRRAVVAVVVPGAVRGEDEIAARGLAALALDRGVAAIVGQDGAARIGRVDVHRRDVARIVDRHRTADGARHLQASAETRIGEQELLALGELDGRHVRGAGDLGDAVEVGADLLPAPAMRRRLHLRLADAAAGELAGHLDAGVAEPGALRRRVRLGAQPDVERTGLGVERLHGGAGVDLGAGLGFLLVLRLGCDGHGCPPSWILGGSLP